MKLLIATTNFGKQKEFISLLQNLPVELEFPTGFGIQLEVEETGSTYAENAALKAIAFSKASGLLTLADDTGLEVASLDGRPGLHSARYSPTIGASDADRRSKLLSELHGKPHPWNARFVCSVALAKPDGMLEFFDGTVDGEITTRERGENGFGYDRLFLIPALNKTMAELNMEEKNKYSHRALAVLRAIPRLKELIENNAAS
jgi:XTP/dITP diphosphohydrolase